MYYEPMPEVFTYDKFQFRLIDRAGDIAIYKKQRGVRNISFEVVIIQKHPPATWPDGRITHAREALPASESWGEGGWTYPTVDRARRKMASLLSDLSTTRQNASGTFADPKEPHSCVTSQTAFAEVK